MRLLEDSTERPASLQRGLFLVFFPLAALWLPLLFHRSINPAVLGYDTAYLRTLVIALVAVIVIAFVVGRRCRRQSSMRPAKRVLAVIAVICVCGVGLELVARALFGDAFVTYRSWGQHKSTIYTYEAKPSHSWKAAGGTYSTDVEGFRTHVDNPDWRKKRDGGLVIAIGGSSVFGFGLNDDKTWPHLLEHELRKSSSKVTIVNAGNNGHASLQLMTRLYLKVLPHRPTHVLYYGSVNDVYNAGNELDKIQEQGKIALAASQAAYLSNKFRGSNYYARTMLAHILRKKRPGLFAALLGDPEPETDDEVDAAARAMIQENGRRFARNLKTMADMCKRVGVRFVLATFLFDEASIPAYERAALSHHNDVLREVARTEGLTLIDVWQPFERVADRGSLFFEDHYHPAWDGAEFLAKKFASGLRPLLD